MTRGQKQGREIPPDPVWYQCGDDLWTRGLRTHERTIFGRREYFVIPERGAGRWVSVDAIDTKTPVP